MIARLALAGTAKRTFSMGLIVVLTPSRSGIRKIDEEPELFIGFAEHDIPWHSHF